MFNFLNRSCRFRKHLIYCKISPKNRGNINNTYSSSNLYPKELHINTFFVCVKNIDVNELCIFPVLCKYLFSFLLSSSILILSNLNGIYGILIVYRQSYLDYIKMWVLLTSFRPICLSCGRYPHVY